MMREWTDIDYAQAAIDMLPDTVEEMEEFLRLHNVHGRMAITRWVRRWTDSYCVIAAYSNVYTPEGHFPTPEPVRAFMREVIAL